MQHRDHVALLKDGVPPVPGAWADFGSGRGAFTLALLELLPAGSTLYSIDQDSAALRAQAEALRGRGDGVRVTLRAADFTRPIEPPLPLLAGAVMANALHYVPDAEKLAVARRLREYLQPGGRLLVVEYNVDRGNPWVPHPLSYGRWQALAHEAGFARTRLLGTRPSSFLREFYAAESVAPEPQVRNQ